MFGTPGQTRISHSSLDRMYDTYKGVILGIIPQSQIHCTFIWKDIGPITDTQIVQKCLDAILQACKWSTPTLHKRA